MQRTVSFSALFFLGWLMPETLAVAAQLTAERTERGVVVKIDGRLFTEYLTQSGAKPVLWPIIGPTGQPMTRSYPLQVEKVVGERQDHIHHRSLWLTHGDVNGVDFWGEGGRHGTIVHRDFSRIDSGTEAAITAHNDWLDPDDKTVCQDVRRLRFGADPERRWIDFEVIIKATNGPVTFGDTKEGTFGIRVAGTMKVDAGHGRIVNSRGEIDQQAWGKPAPWVDYHGPVAGQLVGIAVLNHPTSFRFPTYWHVRTYGLLAANPFGLHDFLSLPSRQGQYTVQPGASLPLRYRVVLHKGDAQTGQIAELFAAYAETVPGGD